MIKKLKIFITLILSFVLQFELLSQIDRSITEAGLYEGFFQLYYAGVVAEDIIVYIKDSSVFIPLSQSLLLLKIYHEIDYYNRKIEGYFIVRDSILLIDFARNKSKIGSKEILIPDSLYIPTQFEYYVLPEFFERVFNIKMYVSILDLMLRVESNIELPVLSEYKRKRSYRFLESNGGLRYEPLVYDRSRSWFRLGLLDYRLDYQNYQGLSNFLFGNNLGMEILGGDLSVFYAGSYSKEFSYRDIRPIYQWRFFLGENPFLTQFSIGNLSNYGYRMTNLPTSSFRGIQISNELTRQPIHFTDYVIEDMVEPGWQIELYRNGALFDQTVSDALGRFRFVVPIQYGYSNLELRIYGTRGEYFIKRELINIPTEFLQPGEIKYSINSGQRISDSVWISEFKGYVGITNWLSLHTAFSRMETDKKINYGGRVSIKPFNTMHLNFDIFPEKVYRGSFNYWNMDLGTFEFQYSNFSRISEFNPFGAIQQFLLNGSMHYIFSLPLNLNFYAIRNEHKMSYINKIVSNLFITTYPLNFRIRYGADYYQSKVNEKSNFWHSISNDISYSINQMPLLKSVFKGARIGFVANYDLTNEFISSYAFYYQQRLFRNVSFRFTVNWDKYIGSINTFSNLQIDFNALRSISEARFYGKSNNLYSQHLSGTIGFDPYYNEFFFNNPTTQTSIGNGAAIIRLFLDANENGLLDNGEKIIPDVKLEVQNASIDRKRSEYGIIVYNLLPYSRYNVYIDKESIGNPLWIPKYTEFSFISDPNVYKSINVPCYAAAVIEGNVIRKDLLEKVPQKGIKLHLNSTDGTFTRSFPVFNDGSFYFLGVPPGDYELRLDSLQMELINSYSIPEFIKFTVPRSIDGTFVQNLNFEIFSKYIVVIDSDEKNQVLAEDKLQSDLDKIEKFEETKDNITIEPKAPKIEIDIDPLVKKQFYFSDIRDVAITKQMKEYLDKLIIFLNYNKTATVLIVGHTDSFGSLEETQKISEKRAESAMKYLIDRGIDKSRILIRGEGSRNPIASNLTPDGRKKNRRIEIQIIE